MLESGLARVRRHHAIEHATVAVLLERRGRFRVAGWSDPFGFHLFGDLTVDEVRSAATEALARLQAGRSNLAVTDLCGGNILVTSALVTVTALLVTRRRGWQDIPLAISTGAAAVMAAPFVGRWLQRKYTTDGRVDGLAISAVRAVPRAGGRRHIRVSVAPIPAGS